ncbi:molybdopterin-dependent oxidoreductase [Chloroflexota bacterium]
MVGKTTLNCCPGNGCHQGCILRTHAQDGKIVKVERVIYPDGEKGDICLRGVAGARLPYHPDRLKHPLKRAGERGEGKWERVTWEQALDEIADRLNGIREEYRSESVLMLSTPNSVPPTETQIMLAERFRLLFGATTWTQGCAVDSNSLFASFFIYGTSFAHHTDPRVLIEGKTKYIIAWACNPAEMGNRVWRYMREAQKKGARLVDIGVLADPTAKGADWWIQVQAGSDGALALAMIDVIIKEKLHDEDYVVQHTNSPFLVRMDNGKLLRENDLFPEGAAHNYVVWDTVANQPLAVAPSTGCPAEIKPALLGTYKPAGIECKPVFQLLADLAGEYPPKRAESISGLPVETIEKLAREYATSKPAIIVVRNGLRYKNGGNSYRCMEILSALTGNTNVMGGGILGGETQGQANAPSLRLNDSVIKYPVTERAPIIPQAQYTEGIITGEPHPIKAMVCYASNPLHTHPNRQRWFDDILPNLELIVVNDIFMTATAEYADYVLPDCTLFERDDMDIGLNGHILCLDKAIEPMYECKPPIYFWSELAKRLGFGQYYDKTIEEWTALRLASEHPSVAGIKPPLTAERLKKEKMVRANVPQGIPFPRAPKRYRTPSGRLEFYNEELVPAGDELPIFREQMESPRSALAKRYPLVLITANNRYFVHTMFANEPKILEQYMKEPHLSINPVDAEERNIADGDVVSAHNDRGRFVAKALVSETVPPGVVNIPHGWWPTQYIEGHPHNLVQSVSSMEFRDESREIYWDLAWEKSGAGKKGFPETLLAYSPDTLFDCLCEVVKYTDVH